jgi:hypothetical protein
LLFVLSSSAAAANQPQEAAGARTVATWTAEAIRVDGQLDEAAWQRAAPIGRPGNDLFLVVNRGWFRTLDDGRFEPLFDRESAKLQYTFRF